MILTDSQKKVLDLFKKSDLVDKFYWTGGTLLSYLYLQHRLSFDIDFFSDKSFSFDELVPFMNQVQHLFHSKTKETKIYDRWEIIIETIPVTRLEFVYYNHQKKRLKPLKRNSGILIDSLDDIAANKVIAYFDRNEPKDLYDLYFLMTKKDYTVNNLLQLTKKKFGFSFSEFMFWSESTKSFKKMDSLEPYLLIKDDMTKKKQINKIQDYFLCQGKSYLENQLT